MSESLESNISLEIKQEMLDEDQEMLDEDIMLVANDAIMNQLNGFRSQKRPCVDYMNIKGEGEQAGNQNEFGNVKYIQRPAESYHQQLQKKPIRHRMNGRLQKNQNYTIYHQLFKAKMTSNNVQCVVNLIQNVNDLNSGNESNIDNNATNNEQYTNEVNNVNSLTEVLTHQVDATPIDSTNIYYETFEQQQHIEPITIEVETIAAEMIAQSEPHTESAVSTQASEYVSPKNSATTSNHCDVCNFTFKTKSIPSRHFQSKKHQNNLKAHNINQLLINNGDEQTVTGNDSIYVDQMVEVLATNDVTFPNSQILNVDQILDILNDSITNENI